MFGLARVSTRDGHKVRVDYGGLGRRRSGDLASIEPSIGKVQASCFPLYNLRPTQRQSWVTCEYDASLGSGSRCGATLSIAATVPFTDL